MPAINPNLKEKLDQYIGLNSKGEKTILNSEEDVVRLINETNLFQIENAIINFRIDYRSISAKIHKTYKNIKITNCILPKGISFHQSIIMGNLYFWENICSYGDFSNCTVKGYSYFSNSIFKEDVVFDYFTQYDDLFFWGVEFRKNLLFRNSLSKKRIDFWCSIFQYKADFNHTTFRGDTDFSNCIFRNSVSFQNTVWGGNISEGKKIIFDNANFENTINFNGADFKSELSISNIISNAQILFERVSFEHTVVSDNPMFKQVSFNHSHFFAPIYLYFGDSNVRPILDFSNIWSNSLISIEPSIDNKTQPIIELIFNHSILTDDSIIQIKNICIPDRILTCNDSIINGVFSITNSSIDRLHIKNTAIIGAVILKADIQYIDLSNSFPSGSIITDSITCITPINRETASILRHEKEKQGDVILSLEYRRMEMTLYQDYFKKNFDKVSIEEQIIVKLNWLSNNYGQSWLRGMLFTCITAIVSTLCLDLISQEITLSGTINNLIFLRSSFWKDVIAFLWLPSTSLEGIDNYGVLYLIVYCIGKIIVAYGIIQTVLSFRRYSKA